MYNLIFGLFRFTIALGIVIHVICDINGADRVLIVPNRYGARYTGTCVILHLE